MNKTHAATRFTLRIGKWYAAEFIGDEFSPGHELRSYSAIRVDAIEPSRSGQRRFHLSFCHANYPEGVRDKRYSLDTLERGERFILTRSSEHTTTRLLLIYDVSWPWLRSHFGVNQSDDSSDIGRWLSNHA
jgi:hypothetical protein